MSISRYLASTAAVVVLGTLAACGGGGGGGGGGGSSSDAPLQYSGNTNAAAITTSNASTLAGKVMGGGDVGATTAAISGGNEAEGGQGLIDVGRRLVRSVRATAAKPESGGRPSAVLIDQTDTCTNGGTVRTFGDVSPGGTGTVNVTYTNCNEDGDALSGNATMRIDRVLNFFGDLIPIDYTISFVRLALRGASNVDLGGSLRVVTDVPTNKETVTENVVAFYNNTGRMTKSENMVFIDIYNNLSAPSNYVESISGRVFDSIHGFVDIVTVSPFVFSTLTQAFPGSGELLLSGAANRRIRVMASSVMSVTLALDLDGNGVFEGEARLAWSSLTGPAGADLGDSDGDGMHNSWETTKGLASLDPTDATLDSDGDGASNIAEYRAGTEPNDFGSVPPPALAMTLPANSDLIFDSGTQRIYAAVRGNPGSIVPINPATGIIGAGIPVGIDPVKLARSDNGQYLYVGLDGQPNVQRINLATPGVDLTIPLGSDPSFGSRHAEDIAVLPGSPQSIAVSLKYLLSSPRHAGVAIYDNDVQRPTMTPGHTGSNVIEFSASAGTLYGYNTETTDHGFRTMTVDSSGVSVASVSTSLVSAFGVDIRFGAGLIFTTNGRQIDPTVPALLGTFSLPVTFGNLVAHDAQVGRVFFLTLNGSTWRLQAFDATTRVFLAELDIPGVTGSPGSLIRYGAKGLAFRTSSGQIFLIESTALIP